MMNIVTRKEEKIKTRGNEKNIYFDVQKSQKELLEFKKNE